MDIGNLSLRFNNVRDPGHLEELVTGATLLAESVVLRRSGGDPVGSYVKTHVSRDVGFSELYVLVHRTKAAPIMVTFKDGVGFKPGAYTGDALNFSLGETKYTLHLVDLTLVPSSR